MENKNLVDKAKEILEKIIYITIASVTKDGEPWNSPISAYFDDQYNFYWASWTENQHSQNIRQNPNVFLVIYDSTAPEGTGEGVYIKAKAYELNDKEEIEKALSSRHKDKSRQADDYMSEKPLRLYKAIPEKVWINVDGEFNGNYVDKRIEVNLLNP